MAKYMDQHAHQVQHLSSTYLAWLSGAILFLSIGLFLFIQKLASLGSDLFGVLSFQVLVGLLIALPLLTAAGLYKSLNTHDLKTKYHWIEASLLLSGAAITLLLEMLSRIGLGISTITPLQHPTDLTMPILLFSVGCSLISKRYKNID